MKIKDSAIYEKNNVGIEDALNHIRDKVNASITRVDWNGKFYIKVVKDEIIKDNSKFEIGAFIKIESATKKSFSWTIDYFDAYAGDWILLDDYKDFV